MTMEIGAVFGSKGIRFRDPISPVASDYSEGVECTKELWKIVRKFIVFA
jgi:hypothetical protein